MKMQSTLLLKFLLFGTFLAITFAAPTPTQNNHLRPRQDDGDEDAEATPGPSFGPQVAQIITGALTGDLSSILSGSFNLVEDPGVKEELNTGLNTVIGAPPSTENPVAVTAPAAAAAAAPTPLPTAAPTSAVTPVHVGVVPAAAAAAAPAAAAPATPAPTPVPVTEAFVEEVVPVTEAVVDPEPETTSELPEETETEESVDVDDVVTQPTTIPTPSSTFFTDDDEAEAGSFVDIIRSQKDLQLI